MRARVDQVAAGRVGGDLELVGPVAEQAALPARTEGSARSARRASPCRCRAGPSAARRGAAGRSAGPPASSSRPPRGRPAGRLRHGGGQAYGHSSFSSSAGIGACSCRAPSLRPPAVRATARAIASAMASISPAGVDHRRSARARGGDLEEARAHTVVELDAAGFRSVSRRRGARRRAQARSRPAGRASGSGPARSRRRRCRRACRAARDRRRGRCPDRRVVELAKRSLTTQAPRFSAGHTVARR